MDLMDVCNDSTILTKEPEERKSDQMQLESIDVTDRMDDQLPHPQLL